MTIASGSENSISYGAYPYAYMNGLQLSNNADTPLTVLDVAPGVCIDSTDTFQMISENVLHINPAFNGLNGLDQGTFTGGKVYAVYLVSDPVSLKPIGAMLSLAYSNPLMPFGYSAYRLLGFATSIAGEPVTFAKGYYTNGNGGLRMFMYDAPYITAVTAGGSATYSPVNLSAMVPLINNLPVLVQSNFTAAAAGNVLNLQPGNATSAAASVSSQITGLIITTSLIMAQSVLISSVLSPVINYEVSAGAVALAIAGYMFDV